VVRTFITVWCKRGEAIYKIRSNNELEKGEKRFGFIGNTNGLNIVVNGRRFFIERLKRRWKWGKGWMGKVDNEKFQELVLKRFELLDLIAAQVVKLTTQVGTLTTQTDTLTTQTDTLTTQVGTLTTQVGTLTSQVDSLSKDMAEVKADLAEIKPRLSFVEKTVIKIENDHGQKLGALLDGYKLLSERLDRHEAIISKKY